MSIIAWIILCLGAGLVANMLVPGRRSQGPILTRANGVAGAAAGGRLATKLFHVHTPQRFFNLSTWLSAIAGAAVLLLLFDLFTMRGHAGSGRRTSWANRCPGCADGVYRLVGAARAPGNVRAADWLYRSWAPSLLWPNPTGLVGQVP